MSDVVERHMHHVNACESFALFNTPRCSRSGGCRTRKQSTYPRRLRRVRSTTPRRQSTGQRWVLSRALLTMGAVEGRCWRAMLLEGGAEAVYAGCQ
jgi:hypothetical protein